MSSDREDLGNNMKPRVLVSGAESLYKDVQRIEEVRPVLPEQTVVSGKVNGHPVALLINGKTSELDAYYVQNEKGGFTAKTNLQGLKGFWGIARNSLFLESIGVVYVCAFDERTSQFHINSRLSGRLGTHER